MNLVQKSISNGGKLVPLIIPAEETITYDEYGYTKIFIPDTIKRYSNLEFWRSK